MHDSLDLFHDLHWLLYHLLDDYGLLDDLLDRNLLDYLLGHLLLHDHRLLDRDLLDDLFLDDHRRGWRAGCHDRSRGCYSRPS
jgi:hypothetical protein